jgi:hypothetical protein
MSKPTIVVTSIQAPTECMRRWSEISLEYGFDVLVIGDKKGPLNYPLAGIELATYAQQAQLPFRLAPLLPAGHYARKNLGYLLAMSRRAPLIFETDDDNAPTREWRPRAREAVAVDVASGPWCNVYRLFTDDLIWPRGLPLDAIHAPVQPVPQSARKRTFPIQQVLANRSPDVDAIWRLLNPTEASFREAGASVALPAGVWCPFNSQATWWWPEVYPLMYLPSFCSFRMTDIWRSFIAQRCLWALGCELVFHPADVYQIRNDHNLMRDFADEVPGYLKNRAIGEMLSAVDLSGKSAPDALYACYEALVKQNVIEGRELELVLAWNSDCAATVSHV